MEKFKIVRIDVLDLLEIIWAMSEVLRKPISETMWFSNTMYRYNGLYLKFTRNWGTPEACKEIGVQVSSVKGFYYYSMTQHSFIQCNYKTTVAQLIGRESAEIKWSLSNIHDFAKLCFVKYEIERLSAVPEIYRSSFDHWWFGVYQKFAPIPSEPTKDTSTTSYKLVARVKRITKKRRKIGFDF